jgi:hypothetical protein
MTEQTYDKDKAREGDSFRAQLLRAKDETLTFSMDDIHKALEGDLSREDYDQKLMPLFMAYMEVTKKLDSDETDEASFTEGKELLVKLNDKAVELKIPGQASK